MSHKLIGTIVHDLKGWQTVECPDAPRHLQVHHLSFMTRAKDAKVGDKVELEYRTGPSYGLWFAKKVQS